VTVSLIGRRNVAFSPTDPRLPAFWKTAKCVEHRRFQSAVFGVEHGQLAAHPIVGKSDFRPVRGVAVPPAKTVGATLFGAGATRRVGPAPSLNPCEKEK